MNGSESIDVILDLARKSGPRPQEYELFALACSAFGMALESGHISEAEHRELFASLGPAGTTASLMGHIFHRPHGHAGDFEIIDKLYTRHVSTDPAITRWDEFVQSVPTAESVRNRAPYLQGVLSNALKRCSSRTPLHLVSLGSGPGREVKAALDACPAGAVRVTCVDMDARALEHSRRVLAHHGASVAFRRCDVLRLSLSEPADVIWSAGLFDYFSDRMFVATLRRLGRMLAPGGEIVIGNFSERCAGHGPLSFVNWRLVYRSREDLLRAAASAGFGPSRCHVAAETVGLNLFLHVMTGEPS